MVAALRFAFDNKRSPAVRNFGAKAPTGDPAADNYDVEITHLRHGYELESRAV